MSLKNWVPKDSERIQIQHLWTDIAHLFNQIEGQIKNFEIPDVIEVISMINIIISSVELNQTPGIDKLECLYAVIIDIEQSESIQGCLEDRTVQLIVGEVQHLKRLGKDNIDFGQTVRAQIEINKLIHRPERAQTLLRPLNSQRILNGRSYWGLLWLGARFQMYISLHSQGF